MVQVKAPDLETRKAVLHVHLRAKPLAPDVDINDIAKRTDGYTGADLAAVANEATMLAIREIVAEGGDITEEKVSEKKVTMGHLLKAIERFRPISKKELNKFEMAYKDFEYVR